MSNALAVLTRPFDRIPEARRKQIGLAVLIAFAVSFPLWHDNDADIDSMANAAAFDPTERNAVTGVGAPSYTSGAHM